MREGGGRGRVARVKLKGKRTPTREWGAGHCGSSGPATGSPPPGALAAEHLLPWATGTRWGAWGPWARRPGRVPVALPELDSDGSVNRASGIL